MRRTGPIVVAGLVLAAAALRVRALFTDFWLDEIFSLDGLARRATSVADIFFSPALRHDNNHHLNTLVLYLLRDHDNWVAMRMPAFVAGLIVVALAAVIARRRGVMDGLFTGALVACSFTMAVYSTEARGYAFVLMFALLGLIALRRYLETPRLSRAVPFWMAVALGLASHPSVLHFYAGACLWSGYRLRGRVRDLIRLHAVPIAWMALWAVVVLRGGRVGGGDPRPWQQTADEAFGWTFGYPLGVVPALLALATAIAIVLWDARRLWREGSDEGLFYVGTILGPIVLMTALAPPYLFARYFLVSLLFFQLVLGRLLARLWEAAHPLRVPAAAALVMICAGNIWHIEQFSTYGRGQASVAIEDLEESAKGEVVVSSTSLDRWNTLPIEFYERVLHLPRHIRYVPRDEFRASTAVEWVIDQSQALHPEPAARLEPRPGEIYTLHRPYPAYGPSGLHWFLYQREPGRLTTSPNGR